MRLAKIFRFGPTRAQFGVDVYNVLEQRCRHRLQQRLLSDRCVAHADGDSAGALRAAEYAVRFLIRSTKITKATKITNEGRVLLLDPAWASHQDPPYASSYSVTQR